MRWLPPVKDGLGMSLCMPGVVVHNASKKGHGMLGSPSSLVAAQVMLLRLAVTCTVSYHNLLIFTL